MVWQVRCIYVFGLSGFLHLGPSSCHVTLKSTVTQCCWTRYWNAKQIPKNVHRNLFNGSEYFHCREWHKKHMCIVYVCIAYGHIYYISAMVTCTLQLNGCIHISCSTGLKWRHCSSLVCSHGEGLPMSTDDFFPITETCALLMVSWLNMLISFYVILFLTFPPLQRKIQLLNNLIVKRSSIIHSFSQTREQIIVIFVMPLVFVV